MLQFKLDENLPIEAARILSAAGHDAVTVIDQQLGGNPDSSIADVCRRELRALITLDLDFADIRSYPPGDYSGIIVLRLARLEKHRILATMERLTTELDQKPLGGRLWIVDESNIRVRE